MKTVDFIKQEDFSPLIPLIEKFAAKTDTPFYQHVHEVSSSLVNDNVLTVVGTDDEKKEKVVAYICGFYLNKLEFMVSQFFSSDPQISRVMGNFLDDHLTKSGIIRIVGLSKHNPRVLERYGFKLSRFVMVKELKRDDS